MKLEALVRWKMDTVNAQAEKTVVAPTNQMHGLLEIEVGTLWLGASSTAPAVSPLRFSRHEPASGHAGLLGLFPGTWFLFFPTHADRRPVSSSLTLPPRDR